MLPKEVTKLIGKIAEVSVLEVEKGAIKKFAEAVDDPNPLYWDEDYAKKSKYRTIIAPPGFFGLSPKWGEGQPSSTAINEVRVVLAKAGYTSAFIDLGTEFDFFRPARAGDTLTASTVIKDITEREGKTGKMVFNIRETTYTNQKGELVAKARGTLMQR